MVENLDTYESKMKKSYQNMLDEFGTVRAGRANPHVLDKIMVDYYGTPTPIQQIGNVTVPADSFRSSHGNPPWSRRSRRRYRHPISVSIPQTTENSSDLFSLS